MSDIFLSYASADRAVAQRMADALEALGWSVWWDREIPYGKAFDQVIEEQLNAARCVIVLWSEESVASRWVKTEAAAAADLDRLLPVLIADVPIPFEFRRIHTAMLQHWSGDREDPEFLRLVDSVRGMVRQPASGLPSSRARTRPAAMLPRFGMPQKLAGAAIVALALALFWWGRGDPDPARSTDHTRVVSPEIRREHAQPGRTPSAEKTPASAATAGVRGIPIKIGDLIDYDVPVPGAGHIEAAGAKDVYTFSASAGQRVYFRKFSHGKGMEQVGWKLTDPDGVEVFDSRLYDEPGVQLLRKSGTYAMSIGSESVPATGTYRVQLFNVPPPQQFTVKPGEKIREGTPAKGAGEIESPGVKDVYTFVAAAGQRIYFRKFEHGRGMDQIGWSLVDADGTQVFDSRLHDEPGTQVLRKGGSYKMTVGSDRVPATGTYHLQLFTVPSPHRFAIRIGDTIAENSPGAGAGLIESPGAHDLYTFTASPGQRVYFRKLGHDRGMEQIAWKLVDSDGVEVFDSRLYTEPGAHVLRKGGTYTLTVGSDRVPATGSYRLQISEAATGS